MFKKYKCRGICRGQQLRAALVGNFLNLLTLSAILIIITLVTIVCTNHFRSVALFSRCKYRTFNCQDDRYELRGVQQCWEDQRCQESGHTKLCRNICATLLLCHQLSTQVDGENILYCIIYIDLMISVPDHLPGRR